MAQSIAAQTIGEYFHTMRVNLNLSLRDVASTTLSAARLSRFERGTSDISTLAAMTLINNLGMNRTELRAMQHINPYVFPTNLVSLILVNDVEAIHAASARFFAAHEDDSETYLTQVEKLIFQCAATDITADFILSVLDERMLAKFLAYPESWQNVEVSAVFCVVPFASTEFRNFLNECWQRFSRNSKDVGAICTVTVGLALAASKFGDAARLQGYARYLDDQAQTEANKVFIRQLRPLIKLSGDETVRSDTGFAQFCADLNIIGAGAMIPFVTQCHHVQQQPQATWASGHEYQVKDVLGSDDQSIGTRLGVIRRQRGLPMATVCQGWSLSAQSRFESNESQLSFVRANTLSAFLLTEWSDLSSNTIAVVGSAFNAITALRVEQSNLNPTTAAPVIERLISQLADVPPTLRATLVLPVRLYSYAFNYDHIPDALMEQAVKTLSHLNGWNQAYYALFNCSCGNMVPATSLKIWRSIIGADKDYQPQIAYRDLMDYYICLQVKDTDDAQLASTMLKDLTNAQVDSCASVETMFNRVAQLLCRAVITPQSHMEIEVAKIAHAMVALGYTREIQEQIPNLVDAFGQEDFLADIASLD